MRKIDSSAYNKRLHSELMELDKLLHRINPEHVNELDSELIKTAFEYQALLGDSTWSDTSNFNGIEMSKVKQMIRYMKTRKKRLKVFRDVSKAGPKVSGETYSVIQTDIKIDEAFDGRNSFVFPRLLAVDPDTGFSIYLDGKNLENEAHLFVRKSSRNVAIEAKATLDTGYLYLVTAVILWR